MSRRQTWATLAVVLLCGGVLVLFTNAEVGLVRWFNCGPLSTSGEQRSDGEASEQETVHENHLEKGTGQR